MTKNKVHAKMLSNLTQADVKAQFDYDAESGILFKKFKSGKQKPCGHKPVCNGYGRIGINGINYLTHRIIWLWYYGAWPKYEIDHIDRDRMNNRIENLEDADRNQNMHNQGIRKNNTTGYPGVSWREDCGKYRTKITNNRKQISIGYYRAAEEAFLAYMVAKIEHHPESLVAKEYLRELTYAG